MPVLLRRHVIRRSDAGTRQVYLLVKHLRDPEISEFDSLVGDEDVGRLEVAMQYALIVHIKDGECDLGGPVDDLLLFQLLPAVALLLLDDELVEIPAGAELHDDVELLPLDDGLAVRDDVDVLERLQQLHLVEDVLGLFGRLVRQLHLLYHVILVLGQVASQVSVAEGAE